MNRTTTTIATLLAGLMLAGTASAHKCPSLMQTMDAALQNPEVTEELSNSDLEYVRALRMEGEEHHEAGMHGHSVQVLEEAIEVLGVEE